MKLPLDSGAARPATLPVMFPTEADYVVDDSKEDATLRELAGARLVLPHEGGSLRTIITGTKKHATGVCSSRKTGFRQYWEGFPERMMILESEVDYRVVDYQTQPFRFEFVHAGRRWTYIADHCRQLSDGTVEVIEVKRTARDLQDPDYATKLGCVNELCCEMGWYFKVAFLSKDQIPRQRRKNLEIIHARRFATVDQRHHEVLRSQQRNENNGCSVRDLASSLSPGRPHQAMPIVQAMIAHGRLAADLNQPLTPDTFLSFVKPAPRLPSQFRI